MYDFLHNFTETALTIYQNLKTNTDISKVSYGFEPSLLPKPSNIPLVYYHYSFIFRSQGLRIKILFHKYLLVSAYTLLIYFYTFQMDK